MKIKHCILFIVLGLVITTCKKFPEDPFISLDTVKGRLKGNWKFESILYNGNDITATYNDTLTPYFIKDRIAKFSFDRKSSINDNCVNDLTAYGFASLYFEIQKKSIFFRKNSTGALNNLFLNPPAFQIRKLYRGHLKITNSNYEINFTKIK
ncbi:MAG: hypothetical protein HYX39_02690 [Bacteroidetes bacterium]|nr:hypothetical protein [Bacteroidota bacterium]